MLKTCEVKNVRMIDIKRMWNEFAPQASPQSNKKPSEIARSGFVPIRKG